MLIMTRISLLAFGLFLVAVAPAGAAESSPPRPNIIFVLTDDLSANLLPYMSNVEAMEKEGATFSNYFVTDSLCCPSRASIFTGKFPHNTGVFKDGGLDGFNAHGYESQTFALALQQAGYTTAMMGKYLNKYKPRRDGVAKGWNEWDVGGSAYDEFNYELNQNGRVVKFGHKPEEYLTDVLSNMANLFIRSHANGPFFLEVATFAPHRPYVPAPRDADKFPKLVYERSAAYGARPDNAAPQWLKDIPPLDGAAIAQIDKVFRKRVQSVQAVDRMIGEIRAALAATGHTKDTFIVFSSDNGLHMGEYSLRPGKQTPFDIDIKVPLIVIGPGVRVGRVIDLFAENIDLCPTFTEIAGSSAPTVPDGTSLLGLLTGDLLPENWRDAVLIEHHHHEDSFLSDPDEQENSAGRPTTYEALRSQNSLYVEYADNEISYYDLSRDPFELKNIAATLSKDELSRLHQALIANEKCKGASCWAAQHVSQ